MEKKLKGKDLEEFMKELNKAEASVMLKWGFTLEEISKILNIPEASVKVLCHSGRFEWK